VEPPPPPTGDPFPRERFGELVRRLPRYARLAIRLAADGTLSRRRRAALVAGAAYLLSPIDFVPGIVPVLGQLDDVVAVLLAIRLALSGLDPATRERHLVRAGLTPADLDADIASAGAIAAWIARASARTGIRVAGTTLRATYRVGAVAGHRAQGWTRAAWSRRPSRLRADRPGTDGAATDDSPTDGSPTGGSPTGGS
jgi:uncharacterized membrane protein YkvA (DUF1232 family)